MRLLVAFATLAIVSVRSRPADASALQYAELQLVRVDVSGYCCTDPMADCLSCRSFETCSFSEEHVGGIGVEMISASVTVDFASFGCGFERPRCGAAAYAEASQSGRRMYCGVDALASLSCGTGEVRWIAHRRWVARGQWDGIGADASGGRGAFGLYGWDQALAISFLPFDVDEDGTVGAADLAVVLANWSDAAGSDSEPTLADVDLDGVVGPVDLAAVLSYWGTIGGDLPEW